MRRRNRFILSGLAACVLVVAVVMGIYRSRSERPLDAAEALHHVQLDAPRQVIPLELVALNPKRKTLGIAEIGQDWRVAPTKWFVFDGPQVHVLVDGGGKPSKVILWTRTAPKVSALDRIEEYQVQGNRIEGLAARWIGNEHVLERTEEYRKDRLVSANFYSPEDEIAASCTFRNQAPWDGRYLQRYDRTFSDGGTDMSYRHGKQHGEERVYTKNGRLVRMQTFKDGVLDGPSRFYDEKGNLSQEYSYADGVARRDRSWYPDGQLQSETEFDEKGRRIANRHWSPDGTSVPGSGPATR